MSWRCGLPLDLMRNPVRPCPARPAAPREYSEGEGERLNLAPHTDMGPGRRAPGAGCWLGTLLGAGKSPRP